MRCTCCDRLLNDFESTRKNKSTGEYLDMCNKCHSIIQDDIQTVDRTDLSIEDVPDDEVEFDPCVDYDRYNDEE
jgi:cytochrome c1